MTDDTTAPVAHTNHTTQNQPGCPACDAALTPAPVAQPLSMALLTEVFNAIDFKKPDESIARIRATLDAARSVPDNAEQVEIDKTVNDARTLGTGILINRAEGGLTALDPSKVLISDRHMAVPDNAVLRDHEWCVPHDHVEPDQERWERDQAAVLAARSVPDNAALRKAVEDHVGRFSGYDFDRDHEELRAALEASKGR